MKSSIEMSFRIPSDVLFRVLDGEAVILNLRSGIYFGLDTIGTRMWQLIRDHSSSTQIISILLDEYEVAKDQLEKDLEQLIEDLLGKGLIETDVEESSSSE